MAKHKEPILLSWSGGKDSAMTLWELRKGGDYDVTHLITTISECDQQIPMHGIKRKLLESQAKAIGLPLTIIELPKPCPNETYVERMHAALLPFREQGISKIAFGDIYLDDLRDFREEHLEDVGFEALFPLWHRDTKDLAYAFINAKFKAVITCICENSLKQEMAGRVFERSLLADLPLSVDPCGENGEFHTFVYDGPLFNHAIPIKLGKTYNGGDFFYCEIRPKPATRAKRSS